MEFLEGLGIAALIGLGIVGIIFLVAYIWSIIYAYNDAERRGWNGLLIVLLVAIVSWPISFIVYLIIRPKNEVRTPGATDF